MSRPPTFISLQDHISRLGDVDFWWPYLEEILKRHGLVDFKLEPVAGFNATYPTFLYGNVVVKLFGYSRSWRARYLAEQAALALVATEPQIPAPRLLGYGYLYDDIEASWPYLITTKILGVASKHVVLTDAQRLELAAELGRHVGHMHAILPLGVSTDGDWSGLNVAMAAKHSSLPLHLVDQIDDYVSNLGSTDCVFTHGDLCKQHVFVENGKLSGIIDWGDAMATDRHYELIQLYRDVFNCDKAQFRIFLDASNWPVGKDFPRQVLGHALRRQAIGLAQHHSMDVFEPIAALLPLKDIETLDQLATELFRL